MCIHRGGPDYPSWYHQRSTNVRLALVSNHDGEAGTYHVQVEECNSEAEIVLIEHSLKLMVQEGSTLCEPNTSPGIKGTALELYSG